MLKQVQHDYNFSGFPPLARMTSSGNTGVVAGNILAVLSFYNIILAIHAKY